MVSEHGGLCGLRARVIAKVCFLVYYYYYWTFLHPFSYSFINLCMQKLLGILQTEQSEPCPIWNSSIIFITVIWHFSRKKPFQLSDQAKAGHSVACQCLFHLCCAAGSRSLTVMQGLSPCTTPKHKQEGVLLSFCHYICTSISHYNLNFRLTSHESNTLRWGLSA